MPKTKFFDLLATGLAIFAMFFGAGNIIFPLVLGQQLVAQLPLAILGLLLTAVLIPFSGLLTMFFYHGNIRAFFGRLGEKKGLCLALCVISLLGPFGSTPRCIALALSTFRLSFADLNPYLFNAIACLCLFIMSYKKQRLLAILGYFLTPILVVLLAFIIVKGFWAAPLSNSIMESHPTLDSLWIGLKEGYNTMDLLAAFFFAPVILSAAQLKIEKLNSGERFQFILKASAIGAGLLSLVYICFYYLAASYASSLQGLPADQLLGRIALHILGPYAGLVVCLTVVLACLTTAIALITAFSGFIHREIFKEKSHETIVLLGSVLITYGMACFEFQGISKFLGPILEVSYPVLILLTAYNLIEHLLLLQAERRLAIQTHN
jgi:branched-chain amino acid:cation transporter, LIVCS family